MEKDFENYINRFGSRGIDLINFLDFMLLFLENNNILNNCRLFEDIRSYTMVRFASTKLEK